MGTHPIFESDFDCLTDFAFRFYLLVLLVSHIVSLGNIIKMIEVEEKMQNTEITDSTQKTVEPIAELDHKHPLQNRWTLWFFKNEKGKQWKDNCRPVTTFDTVEDFWAIYNHIQLSSKLPTGCDYMLFKEGIVPEWEDAKNRDGGRWLLTTDKKKRAADLDRIWLETLLCLIGEAFDDASEDICGAWVQIRQKNDKVAIWTGDASNKERVMSIGRKFQNRLNIAPDSLFYQKHTDSANKQGSVSKGMRL